MMTEEKSPAVPRWVRKLLIPALIGGVMGFAASAGMMRYIGSDAADRLDASATVAALVGLFYAVTGLGVGLGAASPQIGARFLNVEDADELREQKKVLILSAVAMILWGAGLFAMALAAPAGPLPQGAALVIGLGGLGAGCALSVMIYRACDELMQMANLEAAAVTYGLVLLVVGPWAMLAHLGYAAAPAPLDLLTLFYVLALAASLIALGRRGMLAIR